MMWKLPHFFGKDRKTLPLSFGLKLNSIPNSHRVFVCEPPWTLRNQVNQFIFISCARIFDPNSIRFRTMLPNLAMWKIFFYALQQLNMHVANHIYAVTSILHSEYMLFWQVTTNRCELKIISPSFSPSPTRVGRSMLGFIQWSTWSSPISVTRMRTNRSEKVKNEFKLTKITIVQIKFESI